MRKQKIFYLTPFNSQKEVISWIEIFTLSMYVIITSLLFLELIRPSNLISYLPVFSLTIPPGKSHKFPFFQGLVESINHFRVNSSFWIVIFGTFFIFIVQLLIIIIFAVLSNS